MADLVHISESRVSELLDWDKTYETVKCSLASVSKKDAAFQSARSVTQLPNTENLLFSMPGYLSDDKYGALACKLVTYFPSNAVQSGCEAVPTILANILLMDSSTGILKAVIAGTEITTWRTAAASAVATKHLYRGNFGILAVLGAGTQGRIHAIAFQHFFQFREIRIWNRTGEKAAKLVEQLNRDQHSENFKFCTSPEECVRGADVIVTSTSGENPVVELEWLKKGVHINAIGVGVNTQELDDATYKAASVFVDSWDGAKSELTKIQKLGVAFKGQIGDVILGSVQLPKNLEGITVFQSLGMAVEDCAMARLIYDLHMGNNP